MSVAEAADDEAEALVTRHLAGGDLAAAATVGLRAYGPAVRAYLVAVLRDPALADDAFGDFGEQLWRGIGAFRAESSFRAWAYGVAWHTALRVMRDPYRRRGRRLETREVASIVESIRTATPIHALTGARDAIEELRSALEPDERALLVLRLERRMSWREVGSALAGPDEAPMSDAALRKRFERVKAKLRALAEARGLLAPR